MPDRIDPQDLADALEIVQRSRKRQLKSFDDWIRRDVKRWEQENLGEFAQLGGFRTAPKPNERDEVEP